MLSLSRVFKGRDGWQAETEVPLVGRKILTIDTRKGSRGLRTAITGVTLAEDGRSTTWMMFGDFSEKIDAAPGTRCTEKTVREAHNAALLGVEGLKTRALAFYAAKEAKDKQDDTPAAEPTSDPMDDANYVGHPCHY
jgi:hypothetical protein